MITNFEEITVELTDEELLLVPKLIEGFYRHKKINPIKAPDIVKNFNEYLQRQKINFKMTEVKLRKFCNHIRSHGLCPLIATSDGYYTSTDRDEIEQQIKSLLQRAKSIERCASGMGVFITP